MEELVKVIETTPIIDHHAHNLLLSSEINTHDLLSITSEAQGPALKQGAPSTLAHLRAVHQLSKILECEPTWTAVQARIEQRRKEPNNAWARQCFHGIETVLIDDGLDPSNVHQYKWHDCLTRSRCKRIVRIERIAEAIMIDAFENSNEKSIEEPSAFTHYVIKWFTKCIEDAIADPQVAGFKSVICYRTGLAIPPYQDAHKHRLGSIFQSEDEEKLSRLEDDRLGPYFVHLTARLIEASESKKPFQFHTGLGDNDIDLGLSNPSHLQDFIKAYPKVPIVLLHASYPFTTEAGYLASVYRNVWLDIGEVFPFLSHDGQESVIRDALHLCPSEKLMWSTDGHWFPETYLLAVIQVREGLRSVLTEYVGRSALTPTEAVRIVQDIFFNTSNYLYDLGLPLKPVEPLGLRHISTVDSDGAWSTNVAQLKSFLDKHPSVRYVRMQWLDYTATMRLRLLPVEQALKMCSRKKFNEITRAVFGLLQNDSICPGISQTGVYNLYPVFESLKLGSRTGYATLQCEFQYQNGTEVPTCPRTILRKQIEKAAANSMSFLIGFEVEVVLMVPHVVEGEFHYGGTPVNDGGHAYSGTRALQSDTIMELLETVHQRLEAAGIELQQFHAEACPGQYEFVLGPQGPIEAVDSLLATREIISHTCANANLRATLYPKPFASAPGTGAHLHISVTPTKHWSSFYAGILKHLKSIAALSYSNSASYERVADGVWAGSTWICWGSQNRETPVRRVEGSHFEVRCIDGLSNLYLVVAAVIGAGTQGVLDKEPLLMKDCLPDPSTISSKERNDLGITQQFPKSLDEALLCLEQDQELCAILGTQAVDMYKLVKRTENGNLKAMDLEKRKNWLIERY